MNKLNKEYMYIIFISILIGINILQIYHVDQQKKELEDVISENTVINGRFKFLEREAKQLGLLRDILFYTKFINNDNTSFSGSRIVSILPVNTCGSCLLTDTNILADLQRNHPNKIIAYVLGDQSLNIKRYINSNLVYQHIQNIDNLLKPKSGIKLEIKYPIHILIDSNDTILNVYVTEFYNPENTKDFLERLSFVI